MGAIESIIATSTVPGTTAKLHINGEFLPLVQDAAAKAMFEAYQAAAVDSGLTTLTGEFAGGCADSGFTASVGAPTYSAVLGPVGGNVHTDLEWLDIESIVRACTDTGAGDPAHGDLTTGDAAWHGSGPAMVADNAFV